MLAIAGAVLPYNHFIPFLQENGVNLRLLGSQLFVNKRPEANNLGLFPITCFGISQESLIHLFRHPKLRN
ncbi:DUF2834 domain-containing protein [uncultured Brevibacillus sp.]|uniref:DUF2834 domain-containing protein n=1 Tax=uncultured Brevibacillus sp. TaxID=169970 RepID=UPI00259433D2|nr:DUF2834 domain-containing protein [uncultured Brevibacillus sp.]